jgi:hypothetical protein
MRAVPNWAGLVSDDAQHGALGPPLGGELAEFAGRTKVAEDGLDRLAALVYLDDARSMYEARATAGVLPR